MPANVVKSEADEAAWTRAKKAAAREGKSENYAYIMSIFKKMQETDYSNLVNKIVEDILETTATGAVAIPASGGASVQNDDEKEEAAAASPSPEKELVLQTLAQANPDVYSPLSKTAEYHHVVPKGDQTGGYDQSRPDTIIKNQNEQVKSGIISLILKAGVDKARAEAEAKQQEKAAEIAAKKEEAAFELKHGGKVLDQKQKEWELEKEKIIFKAKHKPKSVKEAVMDDISKYPTEPWGTKVKKPSWNYDAEKYPDFVGQEKVRKPSWNYDAEKYPEFEDVVNTVLDKVDTNMENPTVSGEEKQKATAI